MRRSGEDHRWAIRTVISSDIGGEADNSGRLVGANAYNWGDQPARDVTMTFDASGLRDVDLWQVPAPRGD